MFVTSKVRAKITDDDPVFKTRYLGNMEVFVPSGTGCTNAPVQKLWDNSGEEKAMKKVSTIINIHGIIMKDSDNKKEGGKLFPIENISFCNAESIANGKIFSWISKEDNSPRLICHAVLCSTPEKAKSMALVMSRAFQIAYKEWKIERNNLERSERKDSVKSKTSDLKLKPKYQLQQPGTSDVQNGDNGGIQSTKTENVKMDQKVCENDRVGIINEDDGKSLTSTNSTSSKGSVGSKYTETECQTTAIQNEEIKAESEFESTDRHENNISSENSITKDVSIQPGDHNVVSSEVKTESEKETSNSNQVTSTETTVLQKL